MTTPDTPPPKSETPLTDAAYRAVYGLLLAWRNRDIRLHKLTENLVKEFDAFRQLEREGVLQKLEAHTMKEGERLTADRLYQLERENARLKERVAELETMVALAGEPIVELPSAWTTGPYPEPQKDEL